MGSGVIPAEGRDDSGKFAKGNPGGPGRRPGRSPLHRAVTNERAEALWDERCRIAEDSEQPAERRDQAAEFVLKYKNGTPASSVPDVPPLAWPEVLTVADLGIAVGSVLGAHRDGIIDGAGLNFLVDLLVKLARIYETVELAPQVRALQEQLAALKLATP